LFYADKNPDLSVFSNSEVKTLPLAWLKVPEEYDCRTLAEIPARHQRAQARRAGVNKMKKYWIVLKCKPLQTFLNGAGMETVCGVIRCRTNFPRCISTYFFKKYINIDVD
jgi:hypothetical protein